MLTAHLPEQLKAIHTDIDFIKQHWTTSSDCIQRLWRIKSGKEYRLMGFNTWESFVGATFDGFFTASAIDKKLRAAKAIETAPKSGKAFPKNNGDSKSDVAISEVAARKLSAVPEAKRAAVVERATKPGRGGVPTVTERAVEEAAAEIEAEESGEIIDDRPRDAEGNAIDDPRLREIFEAGAEAADALKRVAAAVRELAEHFKLFAPDDTGIDRIRRELRLIERQFPHSLTPADPRIDAKWRERGWVSRDQFESLQPKKKGA